MHKEQHSVSKIGWLRAAVLGANDGIISTASLVLGVASAQSSASGMLLSGIAGLVAGAMSMATGEYVSVSSQADTETAALTQEKMELADNYQGEIKELAAIYTRRGLDTSLANQVAESLMAHDALNAHARDELGITETNRANPLQAAGFSALSFSAGAILPVIIAWLSPVSIVIPLIVISTLILLGVLGYISATIGGSPVKKAVIRVIFWSALAMAVSMGIGQLAGNVLSLS